MKTLIHTFKHFILSYSLVITSIASSPVWADDSTNDPALQAQKTACDANTASEWSATLNKCVTKAAANDNRHAAEACAALTDLTAKADCEKALAEKQTGLSSDPSKLSQGKTTQSMIMNGAYSIVAGLNFAGMGGAKSSCSSKTIFGVTAIAGLATDAYLKYSAQKKVNDLKNKYTIATDTGSSQAQVLALQYLKDEQKTVVDIAGLEKKRDMLLALGYGAAGVMAAYEMVSFGSTNPDCNKKEESGKNGSTPPAGQTTPASTPAKPDTAAPSKADASAIAKFTDMANSSVGILAMSVIGAVYSGILYKAAAAQEDESKKNMDKIDKIITAFQDSYANYCPNGREDLTQPKCYCYTSDGKQNTDHSNSQTCTALWSKDNYMLSATAGDYSTVTGVVDPVGCVNASGQFDQNCSCKKFVDAKGVNSCMKGVNITIPTGLGAGFATSSGLNQVAQAATSAANGNGLSGLSSAQLNSAAIGAKKYDQALFSKLASSLPASAVQLSKLDDKNIGQYAKSVLGDQTMSQLANQSGSSPIDIAGTRPDGKMALLLKDAEKKAGLDMVGSGHGLANKKEEKKDGMNFNFTGDSNASGAQTQNFPEKQKNYNYKDSDISKRPDTSIFEIISNRYVQSGLKRLFEN